MESEGELVARLRDGDELAFVMLMRQYQMPMLRLAKSMVDNDAVAEEAVQDTWMSVVRGIDRFEARSTLKTWLFRILVNRVRSAHSNEQRRASRRAPSVDPSFFDYFGPVGPTGCRLGRRRRRPARRRFDSSRVTNCARSAAVSTA